MKTLTIHSVTRRIETDLLTPVSLFLKLRELTTPFFLLESIGDEADLGRFSYLGFDPNDLEALIGRFSLSEADKALSCITCVCPQDMPCLFSGIVGHVSYHGIEDIFPIHLKNSSDLPTHRFMLAGGMAIMDHRKNEIYLVKNLIDPSQEQFEDAEKHLASLEAGLFDASLNTSQEIQLVETPLTIKSSFTHKGFLRAVEKAKDYIAAGDVFQVVLSQRFTAKGDIDGFSLYRQLRRFNPAPYLSYIRFPEFEALCSSPEMLVRMDRSSIETMPIAGTRPLLGDGRDEQRATELLQDTKELAEHLMLVDLGRNDMGKVSQPGTVEVKDFCKVKNFSKVMHLVSNVKGVPLGDVGPVEGMLSAFPAGTVSGAPKLRAMEIIDELEPVPRNLYAGAIVILDPGEKLNSCIAIRTITIENGTLTIQAGAGIVYDSDPEMEYQETLNKARALFSAVKSCTKGGIRYDFDDRQL